MHGGGVVPTRSARASGSQQRPAAPPHPGIYYINRRPAAARHNADNHGARSSAAGAGGDGGDGGAGEAGVPAVGEGAAAAARRAGARVAVYPAGRRPLTGPGRLSQPVGPVIQW